MVKFQLKVKAPAEEDPNLHCSVSEAGGDDSPKTPEGSQKVTSSFRLGGFGKNLNLKDGVMSKLGSIRSGMTKLKSNSSQQDPSDSASVSASVDPTASMSSMPGKRRSDLTLANVEQHKGQAPQYGTSTVSGGSGSQAKKTLVSQSQAYHSSYSSYTGMSHETGGPVYDRAELKVRPPPSVSEPLLSPRIWPPPLPDQRVHIRRRKIAAGSSVLSFWMLIVAGFLFVYIWQYFVVEVDEMQGFVAAAAMKQVQVRTEALLAPAFSVAKSLSLAMKMGSSPMEYAVLHRLLAPQFQSSPVLSEVHLTDSSSGSLLVQPGTIHAKGLPQSARSLLLRSDKANCGDLARSCALQPMRANASEWYQKGKDVQLKNEDVYLRDQELAFTQPVTWHGPSFLKGSSYATAWNVYHFNSAYSLVSRLSWTSDMVVRVVLNANGLKDVVREAEQSSGGGLIYICTESGEVLAASDMSTTVQVDISTGSVNFRRIRELEQVWAPQVTEDMLRSSKAQDFLWGWMIGVRVFVRPFEVTGSKTLGLKLRIVLAVSRSALALQWLEILSPVCALAAVLPFVTLLAYLFIKWAQRTQVRMREKREKRRREMLEEKELQAKIKAEKLGKLNIGKASGKGVAKKGSKSTTGKKKAKK